ncbi:hypothetical protein FACS189418_9100 [Clostridia bacterium]|nr:hypothetical protein FACS189418_9100 [Clostridia bacterium]
MKKIFITLFTLAAMFTLFSVTASAETTKTVNYYDESGNLITINGMYYNNQGYPMFNANCYYTDANGNPVYVGGCRVYYTDTNGNLTAGNHYYDADGNIVSPPTSYPNGWGCGSYCYNVQGNIVNGAYYYDDFGNPIDPPATTQPSTNYCCGHGGSR